MHKKLFKNLIIVSFGTLIISLVSCQRVLPPQISNESDSYNSISEPDPKDKNSDSSEEISSTTSEQDRINDTSNPNSEKTSETTTTDKSNNMDNASSDKDETSNTTISNTGTENAQDNTSTSSKSFLEHFIKPDSDEDEKGSSSSNPFLIGEIANFDGYDTLFDPFRAEVIIQKIIRGSEALQMVKDASPFNPSPNPNTEYLVAQVLVKGIASKNQETIGLSPYFFSLANGDNLRMYGDVTLVGNIKPILSPITVGETSIAYICFQVDKNDTNPYIVFLSRANGGIWFSTNEEDTLDKGSKAEHEDKISKKTTADAKLNPNKENNNAD